MAAPRGLAFAGFFVASDGGNSSACPWPHDGARGGHKVFMQHDCAACHSMLPYAGLAAAAAAAAPAQVEAEIVVVHEPETAPQPSETLHGPPDLSVITRTLRHSNLLYTADELNKRMPLPTPVCLQFLQPYYMRNPQAA